MRTDREFKMFVFIMYFMNFIGDYDGAMKKQYKNNHFEKYLQKTRERMAMSLIRMFRLGPDVSLSGSPIVSPITAALWIYEPFFTTFPSSSFINPASMYFLALSHAPPVFDDEIAIWTPLTIAPGKNPRRALESNANPSKKGVKVNWKKISITYNLDLII
jgi:hypothetical protein